MQTQDRRESTPAMLQPLIERLKVHAARLSGEAMAEALQSFVSHRRVISLASFSESGYVRTLYHRDEISEVLVLGWLEGQASPPHDHGSSACGLKILSGEAVEMSYRITGRGLLSPVGVDRLRSGDVSVCRNSAVHQIVNDSPAPLVTLHIYSPPLSDGRVFDPAVNLLAHQNGYVPPPAWPEPAASGFEAERS